MNRIGQGLMDILSLLQELIQWIRHNETTLLILFIISILTFVGTLIAVPMLVVRIPHDYFAHRGRHRRPWSHLNPVLQASLIVLKNALGLILVSAGIFMLVLPGQGILTILIGMTLLNFPGKFRLERWLVSRPAVFRSINWLRKRAGRKLLVLDRELEQELRKKSNA